MIRLALLLAVSFVHGACSPETLGSNSLPPETTVGQNSDTQVSARDFVQETKLAVSKTQIVITSDLGAVTAELVDNAATQVLLRMLPITIEMRDHLRQEKTGNLPSPLPVVQRQSDFSAGTLGLWGNDDFVIYYRNGRVPAPGISVIGRVVGDVAIFDHPGPVTVRIAPTD